MPIGYDTEFVKKPGVEIEYTPEMIDELYNSASDFFHFLRYVKILHPDKGRIEFKLRPYQEKFAHMILNNKYIIGMWARQSGKSVLLASYVLWYSIFNEDKFVGIGSNNAASAKDFLYKVKMMYEELPDWIKPGVKEYNVHSMAFENGTRIQSTATSKNAFRGRTINLLVLDEFAHLLTDRIAEDFYTANYPAISESKESKLVILSTPRGSFNLFAKIFTEAKENRNNFANLKVRYDEVPGRDATWKEEQLKTMTQDQFAQEFDVAFIGSIGTVIKADILKLLTNTQKRPITSDLDGKLLVYEKPKKGGRYVIGVDCARGTGENYSTIQVLRIDKLDPVDMTQVATFADNQIDVYKFAELIVRLGTWYNNCWLMVENNAEGIAVVNEIWWTHEYQWMWCSGQKSDKLGIRATPKTKSKAVSIMKRLIEDFSLKLVDYETLRQLHDFSEVNGKFRCNNLNDDLISALYWATYALELNILEESFSFQKPEEEDVWGILTDISIDPEDADWSWLTIL